MKQTPRLGFLLLLARLAAQGPLLLPADSGRRKREEALLLSDSADAWWCARSSPAVLVGREEQEPTDRWSNRPSVVLRSEGAGLAFPWSPAAAAAALAATPFAAPTPNRNSRSTWLSKGLLSLSLSLPCLLWFLPVGARLSSGRRRRLATAVFGRCLVAGGDTGDRLAELGCRPLR